MVDLGVWIVDVLGFFWVELDSEEGVGIAFHDGDEGSTSIVITEGCWGEHRSKASIGEEPIWGDSKSVVVIEVSSILEDKGTVSKATEDFGF